MGEGCVCRCGLKAKGLSCRKRGGGGSQDFIDGGKRGGGREELICIKMWMGKKRKGERRTDHDIGGYRQATSHIPFPLFLVCRALSPDRQANF